jgi:hypothetical protein
MQTILMKSQNGTGLVSSEKINIPTPPFQQNRHSIPGWGVGSRFDRVFDSIGS